MAHNRVANGREGSCECAEKAVLGESTGAGAPGWILGFTLKCCESWAHDFAVLYYGTHKGTLITTVTTATDAIVIVVVVVVIIIIIIIVIIIITTTTK
jgi:hypothetical protein